MGIAVSIICLLVTFAADVVNPYIGLFSLFDIVALFIFIVCCIIARTHIRTLMDGGRGTFGAGAWEKVAGPRASDALARNTLRSMGVLARIVAVLQALIFAGAEGLVMLLLREQGRYAFPVQIIPEDMAGTVSLALFAVRFVIGVIAAVLMWHLAGMWFRTARFQRGA